MKTSIKILSDNLKRSSLQIKRIRVYKADLPLYEGSYKWSGGKSVSVFDSTVVSIGFDFDYMSEFSPYNRSKLSNLLNF